MVDSKCGRDYIELHATIIQMGAVLLFLAATIESSPELIYVRSAATNQ
ncbi:uncharacterized protein METZ01_LOCUS427285 [marine metagenome]|uniref:Uncharacterized protein n=1 Tax=marine metagenome TaxID=408172 RepID=A0A382XVE7_9ZZZZ